jgi:hypothetical protein
LLRYQMSLKENQRKGFNRETFPLHTLPLLLVRSSALAFVGSLGWGVAQHCAQVGKSPETQLFVSCMPLQF